MMSWLAGHLTEIVGGASAVCAAVAGWKLRQTRRELKNMRDTRVQLEALRAEAGTMAPWEMPLGEQTRSARDRAKK